nr:hypothetical protein [uncultured organism]
MSVNTPGKRRSALVAAVGLALGAGVSLFVADGAEALPTAQQTCSWGARSFTPASGWVPLTAARSVPLDSAGTIQASVTVDAGIDAGAEIRLGWAVNGAAPVESSYGPANLANRTEYWETRSTFGLIQRPAGWTTVQPYVRVSGAAGRIGVVATRCLALEGNAR